MSERPTLNVGDHVTDREDDDATLVVVGTPPSQADEYECGKGNTVAEYNADYPSDDMVIEVVYPQRTTVDIESPQRYAFPRSRLALDEPVHDIEEDDN